MADQIYYSLFTDAGLTMITDAIRNGKKLGITHMAFGDGNGSLPVPNKAFTKLVKEVYRMPLNSLSPDPQNANWLRAEAVIASAIGGFNIRELGLYAGETLVAYSNYPPTYKPSPSDGTARIMTFRMVLQIDNTANFELVIDPDVVMATIAYVDNLEKKIKDKTVATITLDEFGILPENDADTNTTNFFKLNNAYPDVNGLNIQARAGTYKFSKGIFITRQHRIIGVGCGEACQTVFDFKDAAPVGTNNYKAAIFLAHHQVIDDQQYGVVDYPSAQIGKSAYGAVLENIKIVNSSAHGVIKNAPCHLIGVCSSNNAGHGILTVANVDASFLVYGGSIPGIANQGTNVRCAALFNKKSGVVEIGNDANAILNDACLSAYNKEYGFYGGNLLGNLFNGCQGHANELSDYQMQGAPFDNSGLSQTPASNLYSNCYSETQRDNSFSVNGRSLIIAPSGAGPAQQNINTLIPTIYGLVTRGGITITDDVNNTYGERYADFAKLRQDGIVLGWKKYPDSTFKITSNGGSSKASIMIGTNALMTMLLEDFNRTLKKERPWFPNGITMGSYHYQTTGTAPPVAGIWDRGNIVWNEMPASGQPIGWVCVDSNGPGIWKPFGIISN